MPPKVAGLGEESFLLDCVGSCPKETFGKYDGQSQLARSPICDLCKSSAQGKLPAIGSSCSAMRYCVRWPLALPTSSGEECWIVSEAWHNLGSKWAELCVVFLEFLLAEDRSLLLRTVK
jgi:hypothetical protein